MVSRDLNILKSAKQEINLSTRTIKPKRGKGSFTRKEKFKNNYK